MKTRMISVLATTIALTATAAMAAPAVPPPTVKPYGESIDVRVVNVEAVVTDGKGGRVPGLNAAAFRLLVDGQEVPIDYFTEVEAGQAVAPPAPARGGEAPATSVAPAAPATMAAPGEAVGTNYLVYIDDQFSIPAKRNLVLDKLKADLGRLGPHDRMTVLSFDGHKVTRLTDWTGDRQALENVFTAAENRPSFGLLMLAEMRSDGEDAVLLRDTGSAIVSMSWGIGIGMRAAVAAMRGTPAPPGRKVMLFLNGGWGLPDVPQPDRGAPSAVDFPEAQKVFAPVFETANLLGYTLYTVEVPSALTLSSWNDASAMEPTPHSFITTSFGQSVHENLEVMAGQTGGKAILNSAWQNAFERVTADTSSYYWLGFTPQWKADGSRHKISLEMRRPGLAVRSRSGFSDLSRETEAQVQAESLLLYGFPKDEHPLGVTPGVLRRVSFLRRELPVTVEVPADALAPQVEDGTWSLVGTLSIAALDKSDANPHWRTLQVRFKSNGLPPAGATTSVQTVVKLARSTRKVVFAVGGEHGEVRAWKTLDLQSLAQE
ncbi:MAG TPA: VWA domain-containing protein [Thermoanaerobaculia bacterium]|jgi:VWFA-related protein|nr:VWA domain-containing protein [Thermoanaerobaculia bacterium]